MPELPEVETVTQSVKKHLMGKQFRSLDVNWQKTLHNFRVSELLNLLFSLTLKVDVL